MNNLDKYFPNYAANGPIWSEKPYTILYNEFTTDYKSYFYNNCK
jgi:predicted oxidoreductase (fatty acid repression mutant protein)